ncbi:MAG: methionyl-tRNA formyltransferase [Ignavibacteriae bacterium]|nr:MAG: methionyl-tRNA formyltransferase [Ignavibacteriota bacterium]
MNIIFMGTPDFAVPSLQILLTSHHKISAVVTTPDKPKGRGLKLAHSAVKEFALQNNLRVLQPDKLKDENFINEIRDLQPDLIIIVAFRILPKEIFTIPKFGSFNLHASLLPKYRGAAPINWAIINGEKETGVTTFFLKERVDTGNIIMQTPCDIAEDDNAGTLHDKLSHIGAGTVMSTVNLIEMTNGNVPITEQDNTLASPAPKIFKDDCRIDWNKPAEQVHNFIRGLSPYPAAYTFHNGKQIKIFKSSNDVSVNSQIISPGLVLCGKTHLFVSCSDNNIEILELQLEGKKRVSAKDFINGKLISDRETLK